MITELQSKRLDRLAQRIKSLSDDRGEELMNELTALTPAEAAGVCGVHPETVRRWIREKRLKAAKIGHEYRIVRSELANFWREHGGGELFAEELTSVQKLREDSKAKGVTSEEREEVMRAFLKGYAEELTGSGVDQEKVAGALRKVADDIEKGGE